MNRCLILLLLVASLARVDSSRYEGKNGVSSYVKKIASCLEKAKYPCRIKTGSQQVNYGHNNAYAYQHSNYGYGMANTYGFPAYPGNGGQTYPQTSVKVTNFVCIPKTQLCDGISQCPLNDDEEDCPAICSSSKGEVKCFNGNCALPCNGKMECKNGEDERNCAVCPHDEIGCKLIETGRLGCATVCDAKVECQGELDETLCKPKCSDDQIICFGNKSKAEYICARPCDGAEECQDNEDEENCRINYKEERVCLSGQLGCPGCDLYDFCQALVIKGIIEETGVEYCRESFDEIACGAIEYILNRINNW